MSWQAWLLDKALRFTMKRHGDRPVDPVALRQRLRPAPAALRVPPGLAATDLTPEPGLHFDRMDVAEPRTSAPSVVVLYLHGGGYFFGTPLLYRPLAAALVRTLGGPVFGLYYRLAPEHPFPAAVDDAAQAYRWLARTYSGARIVIAGDSAGGGLGLVTALGAQRDGLPPPAAVVAFSPWTDLAATGDSLMANARTCAMFKPAGIHRAAELYLGERDRRDPLASPLYADLSGLPPLLVFASEREILRDDSLRLVEKARAAGVEAKLITSPRLPHVWPIFVRLLPESRVAVGQVGDFLRAQGIVAA